ncbi:hypothetical protein H3V53_07360 [Paraburkholderia bengalensis]|uniref:Uncharacterized protein n=1 Tax=Paraburkholderia bengalensis TaxID=2747562 RepID=A0ABU8INE1_9BURK
MDLSAVEAPSALAADSGATFNTPFNGPFEDWTVRIESGFSCCSTTGRSSSPTPFDVAAVG